MKAFLLLTGLFLGPFTGLHAQELLNLNLHNSCSYSGEAMSDQVYGFASSNDARRTVEEIVDIVGLRPNFEIKAGNVPNAVATIQDGNRLIIYSQDFMLKVGNRSGDNWASVSILAHEIGHHLNGHTITAGGSRPPLELEADQFSGFILGKMGAALEQAQSAIALQASAAGTDTHPPRSARLEAVAVGWNKATEGNGAGRQTTEPVPSNHPPAKDEGEPAGKITPPTPPSTASVTIAYAGDQYGCGLPITVNIGGKVFTPQGNSFTVSGIPLGEQWYTIAGQINCLTIGSCYANGQGSIQVKPNQTYWITWQNTTYGQCNIWLAENQD